SGARDRSGPARTCGRARVPRPGSSSERRARRARSRTAACLVSLRDQCIFFRETEEVAVTPDALRALQAPLKTRYREDPSAAVVTLGASGELGAENVTCKVTTGRALVEAGL